MFFLQVNLINHYVEYFAPGTELTPLLLALLAIAVKLNQAFAKLCNKKSHCHSKSFSEMFISITCPLMKMILIGQTSKHGAAIRHGHNFPGNAAFTEGISQIGRRVSQT